MILKKNTKKIVVKIFEDTHRPHRTSTRCLSPMSIRLVEGLYGASESERLQTRVYPVSCLTSLRVSRFISPVEGGNPVKTQGSIHSLKLMAAIVPKRNGADGKRSSPFGGP